MSSLSPISSVAAELRSAFDRTYTLPLQSQEANKTEDLLAVRLGGNDYAIRVREIAGLANNRKTVALPSAIPELLGIASIRGELAPVYSLAALLDGRRDIEEARWLVLCKSEEPVGLAFADFDGYLKVPLAEVYAAGQERTSVREVARSAGMVRPVISIPAILELVKRRCSKDRV